MKIRTLIVDDQLLGREALHHLLEQEPDIEVVGMATNGSEAVESINQLAPDLVFLDVEMPDLDGFAVVGQINHSRMPIIIFVTKHNDLALKAFDVHALDYLIKPCKQDRLQIALQRVRKQLRQNRNGDIQEKLTELLHDLKTKPKSVECLAVKSGGRIFFIQFKDIDWIEAADNYTKLHVNKEAHMLRETMTGLEKKIPADEFLRISRSAIVNVGRIKELHPMFHGEYVIVLHNGTQLTLTRSYRDQFSRLGLS